MSTTHRERYVFTVKEFAKGEPWIALEPSSGQIPALKGVLGFDLRRGTSVAQAHKLAEAMNDAVATMSFTAE